jgi:hypothetical protein
MNYLKQKIEDLVAVTDLFEKCRERNYIEGRMLYANYRRYKDRLGYSKLGREMGFDHATIINLQKRFDAQINSDKRLASLWELLIKDIARDQKDNMLKLTREEKQSLNFNKYSALYYIALDAEDNGILDEVTEKFSIIVRARINNLNATRANG